MGWTTQKMWLKHPECPEKSENRVPSIQYFLYEHHLKGGHSTNSSRRKYARHPGSIKNEAYYCVCVPQYHGEGFPAMWGLPIPKLVNIPPMVFDTCKYSFHGVHKPNYNVWGPHIGRFFSKLSYPLQDWSWWHELAPEFCPWHLEGQGKILRSWGSLNWYPGSTC